MPRHHLQRAQPRVDVMPRSRRRNERYLRRPDDRNRYRNLKPVAPGRHINHRQIESPQQRGNFRPLGASAAVGGVSRADRTVRDIRRRKSESARRVLRIGPRDGIEQRSQIRRDVLAADGIAAVRSERREVYREVGARRHPEQHRRRLQSRIAEDDLRSRPDGEGDLAVQLLFAAGSIRHHERSFAFVAAGLDPIDAAVAEAELLNSGDIFNHRIAIAIQLIGGSHYSGDQPVFVLRRAARY